MMTGNNKEAYNTLKALTKTQQHKSAVFFKVKVTAGAHAIKIWLCHYILWTVDSLAT